MVNKQTIWTFLEPLMYAEEFIHLAEISRELKSPHATVRQYLNWFEKEGIVIKQIKGRLTIYKINYSNPLIIDYLILAEKNKLVRKFHNDLLMKEIVSFLHNINLDTIIIFGSSVKNTKSINDIDLVVIGKKETNFKDFEKKFNVKFHIINVNKLEEINESLKKEIKKKHLIIENSEKVIKWMLKN